MNTPLNRRISSSLAATAATATLAALTSLALLAGPARAAEPAGASRGIEQALAAAQQDKKGVTLMVGGQPVAGGVTRIEPGQWVEMRSQQHGRIVVRLDRIDALLMP